MRCDVSCSSFIHLSFAFFSFSLDFLHFSAIRNLAGTMCNNQSCEWIVVQSDAVKAQDAFLDG